MRKALPWMFFLSLTAEYHGMYMERMWTPMKLMWWFVDALPLKVSPFEMLCVVMLLTSGSKWKASCATPMIRAIHASLASVAFCWVYGIARGGEVKPTYTQAHMWVMSLVFALTVARMALTRADFYRLGQALFYAAVYRSLMAIIFYVFFVRDLPSPPPVMTTHEDSVLFCVGLLLALSHAIEMRTKAAIRALILSAPIILLAIVLNNRRVAWASLAAGLLVLYVILPKSAEMARKRRRILLVVGPILALYIAIGWGRTEGIFMPVAAFSSMGAGKRDGSTQARDNENLGMVVMVKERPLLGTGFGHQWYELDASRSVPVSVFPMYHYLPHNTMLALLAFTGSVGFAGIWMVLPVSVYLNRRTYVRATHPVDRTGAAVGIVAVVVVMNQMYGDMGIIMLTPMVILGAALGAASRLPPLSGAWPSNGPRPSEAKATRGEEPCAS
jgi:hypothetical protein